MRSRHDIFFDLISGRSQGLFADIARGLLTGLSLLYSLVIRLRNVYFDAVPGAVQRLPSPVISVGNLTVGGTGKTPMTIEITDAVRRRGHRVAILTRGYVAKHAQRNSTDASQSDEAMLLARRCPQALVVVNPRRAQGGRTALEAGCDVLVMDDGFQHRRLGRDLDIVLVDATRPFGFGAMLPRGLLREPRSVLRRANLLIMTRSDQVTEKERKLLHGRLERLSGGLPVIEAAHRPAGFVDLAGAALSIGDPSDIRAVLFAGIANFDGFRQTVEALGVEIAAAYEYPDHHEYTGDELAGLRDVADNLEANALITTEKDAVKLEHRWRDGACPLLVLRMKMQFDEADALILEQKIDDLLSRIPSRQAIDVAVSQST